MFLLAVKSKTKIAIKILRGRAVTQNALGGLIIHYLFANFLYCTYARIMKIS